jgi:hypothetical protein
MSAQGSSTPLADRHVAPGLDRTWTPGRRLATALLSAVLLVVLAVTPALARHWHGSVFIDAGPFWWGAPYPYPYWAYPYRTYPYWWYPPPSYVYPPPPVIAQEPQVYIQQAPPTPPPPPDGPYWYYCPSARAYYPTVPQCPEPWVKVPPRPE